MITVIVRHKNYYQGNAVQKEEDKVKVNKSDNEEEEEYDQHDSKEQRLTLMEEVNDLLLDFTIVKCGKHNPYKYFTHILGPTSWFERP